MCSVEDARIPVEVMEKTAQEFEDDFSAREERIHRFPASLRGLGTRYILPMVVAIGPYHHGLEYLQEMEKVKHVAACHFSRYSGHSLEQMYGAVLSVAAEARRLYAASDVLSVMGDADFAAMMFRDACFLLLFMLTRTDRRELSPSMLSCLYLNRASLQNDIMLLENQLPWLVVETLMAFRPVPVEEYIVLTAGALHIRFDLGSSEPLVLDGSNRPPHLLGLLRSYKVEGKTARETDTRGPVSISAIELAEMGIKLKASRTAKFTDMGVRKGLFTGELFITPLSLNDQKACWLVNMAALEVCTASSIWEDGGQTAVCSYLALLAMLMDREQDVHELRRKRLVHGELTNNEMLHFFKTLTKNLYGGPPYFIIMEEIEDYKVKRRVWIKMHEFFYKNFRTIATVFSAVGVLVGIFKALFSLK